MAKPQDHLITAIDVGSAKTCVLVAEAGDNGLLYRAHAVSESRGSRKGIIIELDKAAAAVQKTVERVEAAAEAPLEHALVGLGGSHVRGVNSRGGITLGARPREISRDEVRQAVEKARAIALPSEWHVLHLLPQQYIVDEQVGIRDPEGMLASRLEVQVHVVTATATVTQNVVTTLNRAGIRVDDTVFEPLACAECVLKRDERELGVCLADVGAGSTELIVFHDGVVVHTGVIPIGGDHFTSDVAVGLRTPLAEAEHIKRHYGNALAGRVPEGNEIEVPAVGDRPSRLMPQRFLAEILEPRARELAELLRENLRQGGVLELCSGGIVLTGGGARLAGLVDLAESILRRPVRLGVPSPLAGMPADLAAPEFAVSLGMVQYGNRARRARGAPEPGFAAKLKSLFARE